MNAKRFIVLTYHEVGEAPDKWTCSPELFVRHLDFLEGYGCSFVTMDDVLAWRKGVIELPTRAVVLHFDDARVGVYEHVAPLLAERKIPAMLYCTSGWSGRDSPLEIDGAVLPVLGWGKLRELAATDTFTIGSHGVSHIRLNKFGLIKNWAELRDSKRAIEDALGVEVEHFAAPYNRTSLPTQLLALMAGYRSISVGKDSYNERTFSPFCIKRHMVTHNFDEEILGGIADWTWNL